MIVRRIFTTMVTQMMLPNTQFPPAIDIQAHSSSPVTTNPLKDKTCHTVPSVMNFFRDCTDNDNCTDYAKWSQVTCLEHLQELKYSPSFNPIANLGFKINNFKNDGNCFFKALSIGLLDQPSENHDAVRSEIVQNVAAKWNTIINIIDKQGYPNSKTKIDNHIFAMEKSNTVATKLELYAAAMHYGVTIILYVHEIDNYNVIKMHSIYLPAGKVKNSKTISLLYNDSYEYGEKAYYELLTPITFKT